MKTRIINLVLIFSFLNIITIGYISAPIIQENSSSKTVELTFEKRFTEKIADDNLLVFTNILSQMDLSIILHTYKKTFYTYKINNSLFKPPITS